MKLTSFFQRLIAPFGFFAPKPAQPSASKKYALFVGRFQPCHKAHEWLFRRKLNEGIPILIYVRDIPPNERNPYTTEQTVEILEAAFEGEDVKILVGPDIESVNWGRGVGYETNNHGECPIQGISATKIRESLSKGGTEWEAFVSPKVAAKLKQIHNKGNDSSNT